MISDDGAIHGDIQSVIFSSNDLARVFFHADYTADMIDQDMQNMLGGKRNRSAKMRWLTSVLERLKQFYRNH